MYSFLRSFWEVSQSTPYILKHVKHADNSNAY